MEIEHIPFKDKLYHLFNESDLIATRFMLALSSLLWGILLLWPGDTFDRSAFSVVKYVMPEEYWGLLYLITGLSALYSLFHGNVKKCLIFTDGLLGSFIWSSMAVGMFLGSLKSDVSSVPAGTAPIIIFALAAWWILIRYPKCSLK